MTQRDPMPKCVLEIWICNAPLDGQGKGMWQLWVLLWKVCLQLWHKLSCYGFGWVVLCRFYLATAVRQIRFHRTAAATWDHKEDIKTTSALLSTNMPIIEWFKLTCVLQFLWTNNLLVQFYLKIVYWESAILFMGFNLVLLVLFVVWLSLQYSNSDLMLIYCGLSVLL